MIFTILDNLKLTIYQTEIIEKNTNLTQIEVFLISPKRSREIRYKLSLQLL